MVDGTDCFNFGTFDAMWFDTLSIPQNMKGRAWVAGVPGNAIRRSEEKKALVFLFSGS
jgi:hypothetical protein